MGDAGDYRAESVTVEKGNTAENDFFNQFVRESDRDELDMLPCRKAVSNGNCDFEERIFGVEGLGNLDGPSETEGGFAETENIDGYANHFDAPRESLQSCWWFR